MSELTVRVDPATGRMVADLSHFLGRTKKAVVRDAVRAFAEMHEQSVRRGISHSSDRAAAATGAVDRERLLAEAGGDVMSLGLPSRVTVLREDPPEYSTDTEHATCDSSGGSHEERWRRRPTCSSRAT
jgi:predicted transcriptional regulator